MLTNFVDSMQQVDFSDMKMPMAVIYNGPKDFPNLYMCRIWEGAGCHPTNTAVQRFSLEELREDIKAAGFTTRFPRAKGDDPVILETWLK